MPEKKKILILAANPKDTPSLRLDKEVRVIEEGLRRSKHRDEFELVQKHALRKDDLRRALLDVCPQIVHFCGHGFSTNNNKSGILLLDNDGVSLLVDSSAISNLFGILSDGIHCVVLNACYSENQAETLCHHIPYVVGMRGQIKDGLAIEFAKGFYDGVGAGKKVETAFELGCNSIDMSSLTEEQKPILLKHPDASESIFSFRASNKPAPLQENDLVREIQQDAKVTNGSSYQAGGNITINNSETKGSKPEPYRTRVAAWLGIITAVLAILTFTLDLPGKFSGTVIPASTHMYGKVVDTSGEGVGKAKIRVYAKAGDQQLIGDFITQNNGEYNFLVKSKPEESVWVVVRKDSLVGFEGYLALSGSKRIPFSQPTSTD